VFPAKADEDRSQVFLRLRRSKLRLSDTLYFSEQGSLLVFAEQLLLNNDASKIFSPIRNESGVALRFPKL